MLKSRVLFTQMILFCLFMLLSSCGHLTAPAGFAAKKMAKKVWIRETVKEAYKKPLRRQMLSPVLYGSLAVQGNSSTGLRAYTLNQGKEKWFFPVKGGISGGVLAYAGRLFFHGADGFFYSLNIKTSAVIWKYYTGVFHSSKPVFYKGVLYFASMDRLYALSAKNGKPLWTYKTTAGSSSFIVEGIASPLVSGGRIYFKAGGNSVSALTLKGRRLWKKTLASDSRFAFAGSSLVMGRLCLYTADFSAGLFCLNKNNGSIVWKNSIPSYGGILLSSSLLFYPTQDGRLLAVNQSTGKVVWTHKTLNSIAGALALYKDTLIYGEHSGLLRFLSKETGQLKGSFSFGSGMSSSPVVSTSEKALYFLSNFGWLYKLKLLF